MDGDLAAGDPSRKQLTELLGSGAVIAEMHDAGCRAHTGCSCFVVVVDRSGTRHFFRGEAIDLLEPTVRCVCSEYR
jgi:hypothetical protein